MKSLPILPICFVWCFLFRVLRVGGTLVLLLSPQLSCLLKKLLEENHTESSSKHESKPQAGPHSCPHPPSFSARRDTLQINQEIHSSPCKETSRQSALRTFQSSLEHQETFRVSLGLIDGIIHKFVKINTWRGSVQLDFKVYVYNSWFIICLNTTFRCSCCLFSCFPLSFNTGVIFLCIQAFFSVLELGYINCKKQNVSF